MKKFNKTIHIIMESLSEFADSEMVKQLKQDVKEACDTAGCGTLSSHDNLGGLDIYVEERPNEFYIYVGDKGNAMNKVFAKLQEKYPNIKQDDKSEMFGTVFTIEREPKQIVEYVGSNACCANCVHLGENGWCDYQQDWMPEDKLNEIRCEMWKQDVNIDD